MKRFRIPQLPLWVWLGGSVAATAAGALGALGLMHYTTASPGFCLSCHSTGETLNVGASSRVHPGFDEVGCADCHAEPPGLVIVGRRHPYSADPKVVSANCRRCHPKIAEGAEIDFKFNERKIKIPHALHLGKAGVNCVDCHANVAHDLAPEPTNRPHMAACINCHEPSSENCYTCHTEGSLAVPNPSRPISRRECLRCHAGFENAALRVGDLDFSHDRHLADGLSCEGCHAAGSKHGQISQTKESCLTGCHKARKPMTHMSEWASEHGEQASADLQRCSTCHQQAFCDGCHGTGIPHPTNWQRSHASVSRTSVCGKCHASGFCAECHRRRRPSSHSERWRATHGRVARADSRACSVCHTSGKCDDCHGVKMPHPGGWTASGHQRQAAEGAQLCGRCHNANSCLDCHRTAMPHPSDWLTAHSSAASARPGLCSTCHTGSDCRTCHRSSVAVPHPAHWRTAHAETAAGKDQLCALCHGSQPCLSCHGAQMPHPDNWALMGHKETASFDESSACFKCHETDLCKVCHTGE